jgi:hypothetical protein
MGFSLASGDLDNDGFSDVVAGAPYHDPELLDAGAVYVSSGPALGEDMNQPTAKLEGRAEGDHAGISVAVLGDIDGDGYDDLAVGAPGSDTAGEDAGEAYVVFGPVLGQLSLETADIRFIGQSAFDFAGQSVSSAGDFDDDGLLDVVIGAPFHDGLAPSSGAAYVFTFHW